MIGNINDKPLAEVQSEIIQIQLAVAGEKKESLFLTGQRVCSWISHEYIEKQVIKENKYNPIINSGQTRKAISVLSVLSVNIICIVIIM